MSMNTPRNFCGLPEEYARYRDARVAVLPVPFDRTASWKRGARRGPAAIIEASRHLELYDLETGTEAYRQGIYICRPVRARRSAAMVEKVYRRARGLIDDGKLVVTLGGDHSVSLGSIRAHAEACRELSLLQLDAHADLRESWEGTPYSHASVMARAAGMVSDRVAVGVRSMDASEVEAAGGGLMVTAAEAYRSRGWIRRVAGRLRGSVYVTVDLDVFDPSLLPATGTPEPGGLDWYQVTELLRAVSGSARVVGFDLVELMPTGHHASAFTAAKLAYTLLGYIFLQRT
jgi:agmatinase